MNRGLLSGFASQSSALRFAGMVRAAVDVDTMPSVASVIGAVGVLSGALSANQFVRVLSRRGAGRILWAGVASADATPRTATIRVTIDGVSIQASRATSTTNAGVLVIGGGQYSSGGANLAVLQPIDFVSSLDIDISSSLTEGAPDKLTAYFLVELRR